jgi:hypothetical protein
MPSQTLTLAAVDGPDSIGGSVVATGTNKVSERFTTDGTTGLQSFTSMAAINFANLQSLAISFRDINGNYLAGTLKTNNNTTPTDTITLTAGGAPYVWCINSGIPKPIVGNITSLYLTPGAAVAGFLTVMATFN